MALSSEDYQTLQRFVGEVVKRAATGVCDHVSAVESLMHPLTAWDKGNESEFIPWMKSTLKKWEAPDA